MKIAAIVVRVLLGLLFIMASLTYFLNLVPQPELSGPMKTFNEGLAASGYFMALLKGTELVCGIALLIGRYVPLALVILAPIAVNILMVHIFLERTGLPIAVFIVIAMAFLAYYHRDSYSELFRAKPAQRLS
jgi:putative oxidoreductase